MSETLLGRPLLVLDLDEAIWHGLADPDAPSGVRFNLRPFLKDFLESVSLAYDLAIWTAASEDWMQAGLLVVQQETGVDLTNRAVFLWHRSRCTLRRNSNGEYDNVKHVRKFRAAWLRRKYSRYRILVIDDKSSNYASGYGHLVKVSEWTSDSKDLELKMLAPYLLSIADEPNFLRLEKRGWRSRMEAIFSETH